MGKDMKKILIYGDSNTYGFDPRDGSFGRYDAKYRWPDILAARYGNEFQLSVDGLNGRQIPATPFGQGAVDKWIRVESPIDMFVFMLGSNDLLCMANPDPNGVAWRADRFVRHLYGTKKNNLDPKQILMIAPPAMALHDTPYYRRYDTTNGKLSQALFEVAEENDIRFMDAAAWEIPMAYDNVHFSELGHEVFAEIVAQQLFEPWLAEMRQAGQ